MDVAPSPRPSVVQTMSIAVQMVTHVMFHLENVIKDTTSPFHGLKNHLQKAYIDI
jgi:hypothetical protein